MAGQIAHILQGKNKPTYEKNVVDHDNIVVINAGNLLIRGKAMNTKKYYKHSDYPGGLKITYLREALDKDPKFPILNAVKGMLPRNNTRKRLLTKLIIHEGKYHD